MLKHFLSVCDQAYNQELSPWTRSDGTPQSTKPGPLRNWGDVRAAMEQAVAWAFRLDHPGMIIGKIQNTYEALRRVYATPVDDDALHGAYRCSYDDLLAYKNIAPATAPVEVHKTWQEVMERLHKMVDVGKPYRPYRDLAKELDTTLPLVQKAFNKSSKLKRWAKQTETAPVNAEELTDEFLEHGEDRFNNLREDQHVANDRNERQDPANTIPDDEVEKMIDKLTSMCKNNPEKQKALKDLEGYDKISRQKIVRLIYEQNLDDITKEIQLKI